MCLVSSWGVGGVCVRLLSLPLCLCCTGIWEVWAYLWVKSHSCLGTARKKVWHTAKAIDLASRQNHYHYLLSRSESLAEKGGYRNRANKQIHKLPTEGTSPIALLNVCCTSKIKMPPFSGKPDQRSEGYVMYSNLGFESSKISNLTWNFRFILVTEEGYCLITARGP